MDQSIIKDLLSHLIPKKSCVPFQVCINIKLLPNVITKRVLLPDVSRVFDILEFLSPIDIWSKIMMRSLWRENLGWLPSVCRF